MFSTAEAESQALTFLQQVGGFNVNSSQVAFSVSSPSISPPYAPTDHIENTTSAIIDTGSCLSSAAFSFEDGKLYSYTLTSGGSGIAYGGTGFNSSLNSLWNTLKAYQVAFNASYCGDFAQLVSTALQTQQLKVENENFSLEITNESSILATFSVTLNGTCDCPFLNTYVCISDTGTVTNFIDGLSKYHLVTTDIAVSKAQAIAVAEPYIHTFAQQNNENVTTINATLTYMLDQNGVRGDSLAVYPVWCIDGELTSSNAKVAGYGVWIWADNGEIWSKAPNVLPLKNVYGNSPNADPPSPLLFVIPLSIIAFALTSGVYLHRKRRIRRN